MVQTKAQLKFTFIFCAGQQKFSIPLNKYLIGTIDHDLADMWIFKEFFKRPRGGGILMDLIQESGFIGGKFAIRQFVGLKDQASQ